jgi:hypothetical protein
MKYRLINGVLIALLIITGGVGIEWLLLTGSTPQSVIAAFQPPSRPVPIVYARPLFQTGVVFPRWGTSAYTSSDPNYAIGLNEIQNQTAARWIELTINLYQATTTSTKMGFQSYTLTPDALEEGIKTARAHGYHVFVAPLVTVGKDVWAGKIAFNTPNQAAAWFQNYWETLQPYLTAAAQAGAEQFALGTEFDGLERKWSVYWDKLIAEAHSVYPGILTYDMNFGVIKRTPIPSWLTNPLLTYVGVSSYFSLSSNPQRVDPSIVPILWYDDVQIPLDTFAAGLGKPVLISEIGYKNTSDALFQPFRRLTTAPPDPELQAAAYNAALQNSIHDPNIAGIYFWAWSMPPFSPNWLPAASVLHHWYTSPEA